MPKRALVVEDDSDVRRLIVEQLDGLDFEADVAADGVTGLELGRDNEYDLVLLDLQLPRLEGVEVCKGIRQKDERVPILILTSKTDELDKVLLLELGADDYITKPFSVPELKARIKSALRRASLSSPDVGSGAKQLLEYKDIKIDFTKHKVWLKGELVELTAREYELLTLLASRPGEPLSRDFLNKELYGYEISAYEKSINSHVTRIRSKIEADPADPVYLLTVRGVGYAFADIDESNE